MPGLCVNLDEGWIEINGFALATSAICCFDLWELMFGPDLKGSNGPKPGAPGVFANPQRGTETTYDIGIGIAGEVDIDGNRYAVDSTRGFERNIWWLRANIVDPTGATKPSIFHTADGLECAGAVQVMKLVKGPTVNGDDLLTGSSGFAMKGVLRLKYPGGGPIKPTV